MYTTFIDYKEEYEFYSKILKELGVNSLLEIGSGTGVLATYFITNGFQYLGLDLSEEMLQIAREKNKGCNFLNADMRSFTLDKQVESILMAGRTISYLNTNEDVNGAFKNSYSNLEEGGIFCFDFIDANVFIPSISIGKEIAHEASYEKMNYVRKSKWSPNLKQGMNFNWESKYYKKEGDTLIKIGEDNSVIRTFTMNEIEIFLEINNFDIKKKIKKATYAFPTYVIVAQKR